MWFALQLSPPWTPQGVGRLAAMLLAGDHTKRPCLGALLGVPCRDTNSEPCDGTPEMCLYGSRLRAADLAEVRKAMGLMAAAPQAAE